MIDIDPIAEREEMRRQERCAERALHPVRIHHRHREPLAWLVITVAAAIALGASIVIVLEHATRVAP